MNITRFGAALTAGLIAASALVGCSKVTEIKDLASDAAEQVVTSGTEQVIGAVSGNLYTKDGLDSALTAISEKVGATPMQVVEVTVIPSVLTVEAIDPNAPTELNQWTYTAGAVGASRPVDYDDDVEALQQNLFAISEVPTDAIVTAVNGAIAASGVKGAEVQSLIVKRNLPFDENVVMLINVEGERSTKQVRADVTGQITEVI